MTNQTATKKSRTKSKAAQIRKLLEQGKLTPKQIAEKVGAPQPYVYVIRAKMRDAGLPTVAEKKIPVLGGIREVSSEAQAKNAQAKNAQVMQQPTIAVRAEEAAQFKHVHTPSPALAPAFVVIEQPTFFERVKERIRVCFA